MSTLPGHLPPEGVDAFTGLVCPDCAGNIVLRLEERHPTFACRVGHAYSAEELVTGKETVLEQRLWAAVFAFEELGDLLSDLIHHDLAQGFDRETCLARVRLARQQALVLRDVIASDRPVTERPPVGARRRAAASPTAPRHDQR